MHVLREPFILPTKESPACEEEGQIRPDWRAAEMLSSTDLLSGPIRAITIIKGGSAAVHLIPMAPGYRGKISSGFLGVSIEPEHA